jgi:predicted dehydrogenase/threonine dehydrogenase-like Zn-dependent dehydrogenase
MKQVIRRGLEEIIIDEVPDPELIPHHVLIRPSYSLISSGTESASLHRDGVLREVANNPSHLRKIWDVAKVVGPVRAIAEVKAKFREYAALGYAGAGVVVDKHPTVKYLSIGDRVAYGGEGTGHAETVLAGRNLVVKVPESVTFEHACFATLGSIAMNAVRVAQIGIGEWVAVIGQGLVGQLISQLVRLQGGSVIATDIRPDRVELARTLGADHGLLADPSLAESIRALTDGTGVDCAIVAAAAKSSAPCEQALALCRDRGRIVVVGAVDVSLPWVELYLKEAQLLMSRAYGPGSYDSSYEKDGQDYPLSYVRWTENRNMQEFLRLVERGRVHVHPLITHVFPLQQASTGYETIVDDSTKSLAVLLRYPAAEESEPEESFVPKRRVVAGQPQAGKVAVALVGAGNIARWAHMPNLKKLQDVTLRAVYSANGVRGKNYALRFGAAFACSDYEEILRDPKIDVVLIASRNQEHASQCVAALRAGKHVFVEKPMALTEQECQQVCEAVAQTGKRLTVGFNRRFAPLYVELKEQVRRRTAPAIVNCVVNSPGISGSYWMADPARGGAILGEACHFVDLLYWLLESEPVSVSAYSLPASRGEPIGENNLVASFSFADGSIGNLTYSTMGVKPAGRERVEVFAPGLAAMVADFKRLMIRAGQSRNRFSLWPDKGYREQLAEFVSCLRRAGAPGVTAEDGARSTIGCLRMLESARTLKPCSIDLSSVRKAMGA